MLAFLLLALLYMWLNTTTQGKKKTMYSLNAYNVRSNCYSHSKHTHTLHVVLCAKPLLPEGTLALMFW